MFETFDDLLASPEANRIAGDFIAAKMRERVPRTRVQDAIGLRARCRGELIRYDHRHRGSEAYARCPASGPPGATASALYDLRPEADRLQPDQSSSGITEGQNQVWAAVRRAPYMEVHAAFPGSLNRQMP